MTKSSIHKHLIAIIPFRQLSLLNMWVKARAICHLFYLNYSQGPHSKYGQLCIVKMFCYTTHVYLFQSSQGAACWFSDKNSQSIERDTRWGRKRWSPAHEKNKRHLLAKHQRHCLISLNTSFLDIFKSCFSQWISSLNSTLNQTSVSSCCSWGADQKPHGLKSEHLGWHGRFAAGVLCGHGV